jgi:hypothetical protein
MAETTIIAEWSGFCPICAKKVVFRADDAWFRDHLLCCSCGSIPRERAVMLVIDDVAPDWRRMRIHECSPVERGTSVRLRNECAAYVGTQLFPGIRPGCMRDGFRCEDLQQQTFGEGSFDLVITQDVMEHVFEPRLAYREIWRTLVPGGMHIHTTPIKKLPRVFGAQREETTVQSGTCCPRSTTPARSIVPAPLSPSTGATICHD